ncbi:hypothetical protein [Polaribacter aquimarinus]|uniref:Uncharacterized protein n=1 Tax=Polaribacter aquimarinus TaxID=2100726 RepID=A0A2U2J6R4_9FLAO|nr:hypothetical protein [Polaribacter aquimarinus]PWG04029.1 hypothetical protein DIS07_14920 [Polaribacter aquimarinus]
MSNLNKTYHKGKYRSGEWAKHLRPYLKRVGNKSWRKDGKEIELNETDNLSHWKKYSTKRNIKVKITKKFYGDLKWTTISKYRTLRDAENAMKQANIIKAEIIEK